MKQNVLTFCFAFCIIIVEKVELKKTNKNVNKNNRMESWSQFIHSKSYITGNKYVLNLKAVMVIYKMRAKGMTDD